MTRWDRTLLVSILIAGAFLLGAGAISGSTVEGTAIAHLETPCMSCTIDLSENGRLTVPGALGEVTLEVRDGELRVVDSPCPNQRCVHMGPVTGSSGAIVCVPGGLVIEPAQADGEGLDDVVR